MSYAEKYDYLINFIGYENLKKIIPFGIKMLKENYKLDKNLNNIPLQQWDSLAYCIPTRLRLSLAERVCILKETAIKMIGE